MAVAGIQELSSSLPPHHTYQVFLSFRGKDTRKGFTDHLYTALKQAGVHTFRDDDEIARGEDIDAELRKAIQESRISVIVFSTNYASSRWCLDELVIIMERRRSIGHKVLPVFYHVDPSQVRKQSGEFGIAFAEHEKRFQKEMGRVLGWRAALKEVADLGGMVLGDGYESKFIQGIVNEIQNQLRHKVMIVDSHVPGIESRVARINLWLQDDNSDDVDIGIIYGVGGIGKGTIAKTVYNQNFDKFEARSFLSNIRETCEDSSGLVRLQSQLLADLTGKSSKVYNLHEGIIKIKEAISCRKVLLVLDDLDQLDQYDALVGNREWFSPGSKIIITARHASLLRSQEVSMMYQVDLLDDNESLQLFSWHAFGQDHPIEGYMRLAETAVRLCRGLPLALQVLGSSLCGKGIDVWESALQKVDMIPDSKIQKILSVSYDSLQDDHDQSLFLDIACFFTGMDKDYVVSILDGCDYYTVVGLQNLIDRSLIVVNEENTLTLHSFLRVMAQEIVRQESPNDPGKRSRLWCYRDAFTVLSENTGTETVKGLIFNQQIIEEGFNRLTARKCCYEDFYSKQRLSKRLCLDLFSWKPGNTGLQNSFDMIHLNTQSFAKMHNLKFLRLNHVKISGDYGEFPKSLVWLFWRGFPLKSIPDNFHLPKLVVLDVCHSSLRNVWKGRRFFGDLKILYLSHCHDLVETPDFTGLPSLERLKLKHCVNLVEIGESIVNLQRLVLLNLKDCINLKKLPAKVHLLRSLKTLTLSGCSKLDLLHDKFGKMELVSAVPGDRTAIYYSLDATASWYSSFCTGLLPRKNPQALAFSMAFLPCSLVDLYLADCNISELAIPNNLSFLHSLEYLNLAGNPTQSLPKSIKSLIRLQHICLDHCTRLQSLPELPKSLKKLSAEGCTSLKRIGNLPNLHRTLQVVLTGCDQLVEVEGLFKLEPITDVDKEIINDMELSNLVCAGNIDITIFNAMANCERKTSPQVLHECGIFSSFLSRTDVPKRFRHKNKGFSISSKVIPLPGHKIRGLNLCTLYTGDDLITRFTPGGCYARVINETKGTSWIYSPSFFAVPKANEDIVWFSHWKFGDELEAGDQVHVLMHMLPGFHVKECGIHVVDEQEERGSQSNSTEIAESSSVRYQNMSDRDLAAYQVGTAAYFLRHHSFGTPDEVLRLT